MLGTELGLICCFILVSVTAVIRDKLSNLLQPEAAVLKSDVPTGCLSLAIIPSSSSLLFKLVFYCFKALKGPKTRLDKY